VAHDDLALSNNMLLLMDWMRQGQIGSRHPAARTVVAALLLAMTLQFPAVSREDRGSVWLTGSLCARPGASG
jgi:hypothetical protein